MVIPLLVVTADASFGSLIRRNLEEGGRFDVHIVENTTEAEHYTLERSVALVFLDTDRPDDQVLETGRALRNANKHIRFIIASGGGWHAGLEELDPLGYLSKPFYLPDLTAMMTKIFPPVKDPPARTIKPSARAALVNASEPPWLTDVSRAAQYLTRLTLESAAQAALITRADALWAYAGQLPQTAATELAVIVARYRDHRAESDLLRFVRLESTNAEHMLYATRLAGGMVLALVFDAETPFSTIRSQAGQLVRSLTSTPPVDDEPAATAEEEDDSLPTPSFADILTDVPPPNPRDAADYTPGKKQETNAPKANETRIERDDSSPVILLRPLVYSETEEEESRSRPAESSSDRNEASPIPAVVPNRENARRIILEPVSPSVYNLTYACLLIPRFPEHILAGDLAERLTEWIPQISVAFGWRLEQLSVHPDYFQWIINIPPSASPAYLMRVVRQHTSEKIFEGFPRYKKDNPSGDFWAPGYLIMGGTQAPPTQLIKEYILQTRQRQGLHPPTDS